MKGDAYYRFVMSRPVPDRLWRNLRRIGLPHHVHLRRSPVTVAGAHWRHVLALSMRAASMSHRDELARRRARYRINRLLPGQALSNENLQLGHCWACGAPLFANDPFFAGSENSDCENV